MVDLWLIVCYYRGINVTRRAIMKTTIQVKYIKSEYPLGTTNGIDYTIVPIQ